MNIGGNKQLYCSSCKNNGNNRCDEGGCPPMTTHMTYNKGIALNKETKMCDLCQQYIGGDYKFHCVNCTVNGPGKCDANGCPNVYAQNLYDDDVAEDQTYDAGIVYDKTSNKCQLCQQNIGGNDKLMCLSCRTNGAGRCDSDGCPKYKYYKGTNCASCVSKGAYTCDVGLCGNPEYQMSIKQENGVVYNDGNKLCEMCQNNIANHEGLHCTSCIINGVRKCDPDGCPLPGLTRYNSTTQMCEEENIHKQCKV